MQSRPNPSADLMQIILQLLFAGALIAGCFLIVRPFLAAGAWATTIVLATWPLLLHVQHLLGGRRSLAVAVMTIFSLLALLVPLYYGIAAIVENTDRISQWGGALSTLTLPAPPDWVAGLPLVGSRLDSAWREIVAAGPEALSLRLAPYIKMVAAWFAGQVGSVGMIFVEFLMTIVIAAIMYANGETAADGILRFVNRVMGERGENAARLSAQAVRAVALGVVVTAIVQATLAGLGLLVVGVPFTGILTAVMFILIVAQLGPGLVLLPATVWAYIEFGNTWGTLLLVWTLVVAPLDSFLRPALIKRGAADLPMLLIFPGVIGGLIAFGVLGLFIGPVLLAVAHTLVKQWVSDGNQEAGIEGSRDRGTEGQRG